MTWVHPTPDLIIPKPLDSIPLTCSEHQQPFQWFTQTLPLCPKSLSLMPYSLNITIYPTSVNT